VFRELLDEVGIDLQGNHADGVGRKNLEVRADLRGVRVEGAAEGEGGSRKHGAMEEFATRGSVFGP
jgi:hypothetical protein